MQNQQLNSNGKTQGHAELILDHERIMWRNINCTEIKIALLVITHTIAPVNLHIELDVTLGHAHF